LDIVNSVTINMDVEVYLICTVFLSSGYIPNTTHLSLHFSILSSKNLQSIVMN
jgi:hypothetical protein